METTPLMLRSRGADASVRRGSVSAQSGVFPALKQKPVVLVDEDGHLSYTTLRKQALVTDMALRHRDIRSLEPQVALPYPPAILVRKQAIVLNLEGLKLIIGREKTLILSVPAPTDLTIRCAAELSNPMVQRLAAHIAMREWGTNNSHGPGATAPLASANASFSVTTLDEMRGGAELPYELRALESGLLCLVRVLDQEVDALERGTRPVLDRIRRGVVRADLEELYEKRTRLVRAVARVTRLKEILEELLDDPELMEGLCLTAADAARSRAETAAVNWPRGEGEASSAPEPSLLDTSVRWESPRPQMSGATAVFAAAEEAADREEIEECEDLVEAYWLQVDALLSRLALLQERIAATEHMVNLDLDARRNQLVSLGLAIDLLLMAFECHMAITSIFGMNLTSGLEPLQPYSLWGIVTLGVVLGSVLALLVARYCRRNGLLFLPSFGLTGSSAPATAAPATVGALAT